LCPPWALRAKAIWVAARAIPPGVWIMMSMGEPLSVRRTALRTASLSSMSMYLLMGIPRNEMVSCLWMRVITLVPLFLPRDDRALCLALSIADCLRRG